jgi:mRNA interferase MazF
VPLTYALRPPLSNAAMNALFSAGGAGAGWPSWQKQPDTSDWQPVLERSLVYVGALDGAALVGFVNVAWDGRDHAFLLDTRVHPARRHEGIGRALVAHAAAAARAHGCSVLHVDYAPELTRFYAACGFHATDAGLLALDDTQPTDASAEAVVVNRGDLFWLATAGSTQPHPHVVIQEDLLNHSRISTVIVCALTTNQRKATEPGNVLLDEGEGGLEKRSVVVVSQLESVAKSRLGARIGTLSAARVDAILAGLRFQQASGFVR